jgi:ATP-dependent helicase/nuclease subunit B
MDRATDGEAEADKGGRVFTIPPGARFFDTLADAILRGDLPRMGGSAPGPLDLADIRIYLPNRAACRALQTAFLRATPNRAMLLPRIRPIGGAEEDALLVLHAADSDGRAQNAPVPQAIGALERRMTLTQLIFAWAERMKHGPDADLALSIAETPAAASELALGLMRLMDEADTEQVDLGKLRALMPERFAEHEQRSLSFLDIVLTVWPAHLAESGRLNPMERRNCVMALEAEALAQAGEKPVIVAGSFGGIPATATLMEVVHGLPRGAIVLPGADLWLDDAGWHAIADHPEHSQAGIAKLLAGLGVSRAEILPLPAAGQADAINARMRFLSEALRPSTTVTAWPGFIETADAKAIRAGLAEVSLINAPREQDEAAAIALILREAAETPGKTATLVTPDRALARRVRAQLGKWGLDLPDGAGKPLATTPYGVFHQSIAEAAATGSQIALLALLKHPLTRLGFAEGMAERAASVIEMAAMRQPWSGDGVSALLPALAMTRQSRLNHLAIARLTDVDWEAAHEVAHRFADALRPLAGLRSKKLTLKKLAEAHRSAAENLAADETGAAPALIQGTSGEAMAAFMAALGEDIPGPPLALKHYPALFRSLLKLESVPDQRAGHPRLSLLGPREARLITADTVIIAGLNEGCWPEAPDPGPWLNRASRAALGLPPPERFTALAGHDFWQLMGAPEVILTRALKRDGTPTAPSRWLSRMEALLGGLGLGDALAPKRPWLHWATAAALPEKPSVKAPTPCPPVAVRPRQLSVSDIASLMANPYAIYAKHILGLKPLEALEAEPGGGERGRVLHETLHRFARRFPKELPEDCVGELLATFDAYTAPFGDNARIAAFWRPRMERFAHWFAETEPGRREGVTNVLAQVKGELTVEAPAGKFTLRASADRIDLREDGSLVIYDYKSGSLPSEADVSNFKAPHLPLEALVAIEGQYRGLKSQEVARLAYLSAKGGDPAGEESAVMKESAEALAQKAREGLTTLLARFDDEATPYKAMRRGGFGNGYRFDAYAHLARVEEWSGANEEG